MNEETRKVVATAVEARAGFLGLRTLAVLVVSTGLLIGFFGMIYVGFLG